jgi:hypothetical protein
MGDNSYKKGIKTYNFRIKSEICKIFIDFNTCAMDHSFMAFHYICLQVLTILITLMILHTTGKMVPGLSRAMERILVYNFLIIYRKKSEDNFIATKKFTNC